MPIGPRIREGGWLRNGKSNQLAARCALHPVNDAFDVGFETEFPNFASICGRAEFRGRERSRFNRRRMCGSAALKAFNSLHQVLDLASARARSSSRLRLRLHRSEEHTSELQSLMRISYAVFCLKKNNNNNNQQS